ncbi:CAP domain-containing protein [bacterium]|nr:CAP domain-containing protein [bacterium]
MRSGSSEGDILISVPDFSLRVLGSGQKLGGDARYEVQTSQAEDGLLHVSVRVKAKGLKASLLELGYDSSRYMPETGAHGDWPKVKQDPLRMAIMDQPGVVYYGAVMPAAAKSKGASGSFEVLNVGFRKLAAGDGFIPAPANELPRLNALGHIDGDYDKDGIVALPDLLALAADKSADGMGGLRQIQANFMLASAPDASDLVAAGDRSSRAGMLPGSGAAQAQPDSAAARPPALQLPDFQQAQDAPQTGGFSSGGNNWPSDKRSLKWLNSSYMQLPGFSSSYGVYQDAQAQQYAERVFELTNYYRTNKTKLGNLRRDPHLDAIAQAQAMHLAQNHYFEHDTPDGLSPFDRLDCVDPPRWWTAGENIAGGQPNADVAVKTWMNSKGHKKNIRNRDYQYMGVGAYYDPHSEYGWYWVQVFASFDQDPAQHDWIQPGEGR